MKWPSYLMLIRHGESAYNAMKKMKEKNPAYQAFLESFKADPESKKTRKFAEAALRVCKIKVGDNGTPLTSQGKNQAIKTGRVLGQQFECPQVIFVSPHLRTRDTLSGLIAGWPELGSVKTIEEVRIREQEHGLALLYNDRRIFHAFHPKQAALETLEGSYLVGHPLGVIVPDVQLGGGAWIGVLVREYTGRRVIVVTHHLSILAIRASLERFGAEEFLRLDEKEKPFNCGITFYKEDPKLGRAGKLQLVSYNQKYY